MFRSQFSVIVRCVRVVRSTSFSSMIVLGVPGAYQKHHHIIPCHFFARTWHEGTGSKRATHFVSRERKISLWLIHLDSIVLLGDQGCPQIRLAQCTLHRNAFSPFCTCTHGNCCDHSNFPYYAFIFTGSNARTIQYARKRDTKLFSGWQRIVLQKKSGWLGTIMHNSNLCDLRCNFRNCAPWLAGKARHEAFNVFALLCRKLQHGDFEISH